MPQKLRTLIRLDASAYHDKDFFQKEESMAASFNLQYFLGAESFLSSTPLIKDDSVALISNTHTQPDQLPEELLERTALWIHSNSGYDNFVASFVAKAQFPIIVGNPIRAHAVAEYILAQLFEHFGLLKHQLLWDRSRKWERPLLKNKNILICGAGLIGSILKGSLSPLCKELHVFDPFVNLDDEKNLGSFLKKSPTIDIILIACSLNSSSHHLIDNDILKQLSADFLLINAARGGLVDELALLTFLKDNTKARAVLDVFEAEPTPADYPKLPNLKRTSHVAGVSAKLDDEIITFENQILSRFLNDNSSFLKSCSALNLRNRLINSAKELI